MSRDAAVYTCLVCSADEKFIADSKGITHHLKECHNLRLYICDMCGQEFFKRSELSAHLDEHITNEERDFQCEVCNRIFSNLRLYRVHKRMHYPQHKNWTCDQCGKRYLWVFISFQIGKSDTILILNRVVVQFCYYNYHLEMSLVTYINQIWVLYFSFS